MITDYYNPSQGPMVISASGIQKSSENLDTYSQIFSDIYISEYNNKFAIDSCWESRNIYYANYETGYVKKIDFDRTELASIQLTNPFCLSIIQNSARMASTVEFPPQDEKGCWIADAGTDKVIKTDKDLNILTEATGISDVVCVASDVDGGCYVLESSTNTIIKLSKNGGVLATIAVSALSPAGVSPKEVVVTANGDVAVGVTSSTPYDETPGYDLIYTLSYESGVLTQNEYVDLSSEGYDGFVESMDIDRSGEIQYLYIVGNDNNNAWFVKYDFDDLSEPIVQRDDRNILFPAVLKVVQGNKSEGLYVLDNKPDLILSFGLFTDVHYADKATSGIRYYRDSDDKLTDIVTTFNSRT